MIYTAHPVPTSLAPFVMSIWSLTGSSAVEGFELILPDGRPELVIHRADPFRRQLPCARAVTQPAALVAGQMESCIALASGRTVETIGVTFTPGGLAPICTTPQFELANRLTAVDEVAGPPLTAIVTAVRSAETLETALQLLRDGLERVYGGAPATDARVAFAVNVIMKSGGRVRMDQLHGAVGTSPRWLERQFQMSVGMAPKRLARIVRFQRTLGSLTAGSGHTFASVALDCGYYDQAHFIADFHSFAGLAPQRFVHDYLTGLTRAFAGREANP